MAKAMVRRARLWILIKTECVRGRVFATRAESNFAPFEYIDG
jgi:hypothetical protein